MSAHGGSKTTRIERYVHHSGEELEIPVGTVVGARSGPKFGVSSGMHAGEFAGMRAAIRLFQELDPATLRGEVRIIPIMSTRAFFARSTQLSPVDERELHFQPAGRPEGTYSEFQIDCVFNLLRDFDFHVDMHAGEYVQALDPWVAFADPTTNERLRRDTWRLAGSMPVPYLDPRQAEIQDEFSKLDQGLPFALLGAGVANVWTEIGQNGVQDPAEIELQYQSLANALKRFDMIEGEPVEVPPQAILGPRRWSMESLQSGYWQSAVSIGQKVSKGQRVGVLEDLAGNHIKTYTAPEDAVVQYFWTSPAINAERVPHGYPWHRGLIRLSELRPDAHRDPRLELAR